MKNTVRYSDTRSHRIESLSRVGLAVAGLLVGVIGLVYFGQFLDELGLSLWRMRGGAPVVALVQQRPNEPFRPQIPKTWDDTAVASLEAPLAMPEASPVQIDSSSYYKLSVRAIHKSYPVYHPRKEPPGYFERLQRQEPEIVFDPSLLKTKKDWITAGELVFDAPTGFGGIVPRADNYLRDPKWYEATGAPVAADGTLPFYRYVIREKGKVEIGLFSCGMCHTRVMANGAIIKGAQGNFPFDRASALDNRHSATALNANPATALMLSRACERSLFATPWIKPDPYPIDQLSTEALASVHEAIPPGVLARHGTSPRSPAKIPDLIGIQGRRYLDATGLVRHRDIGDLMRYAAVNQEADILARYGDFSPIDEVAKLMPEVRAGLSRFSDEQLYALALYIYSLEPPANPNKFDAQARRGEAVFQREGCTGCHTPPLYTNNKLTPAVGFKVPKDHARKYDILQVSVGTNPDLTLKTRRGTGYYKVPSLKGVWYRGPFEHNGSVATLEDWFDPRRLRDDYIPTGFIGLGLKNRALKGHEYGLNLTPEDKRALIAFLKTL